MTQVDIQSAKDLTSKDLQTVSKNGISIIIPAYNEERCIYTTINQVINLFDELTMDYEIIVVDDGSTDNTFHAAGSEKFDHVKVVGYKPNMGKGHAIKYGLNYATKNLVTFLDADNELDPRQITILLEYMKKKKADVVVGSKRHPLSTIEYYPAVRKFLSKMYNIFLRFLLHLNISDTQAGFKIMKREALERIFPFMHIKRYAFDVEFLAYAHHFGYKIVEAPIILKFTREGWGRVDVKMIVNIFLDTVAVAYRFGVLKYYSTVFRQTTAMLTAFFLGVYFYKRFINPYILPGIEARTFMALFILCFLIIVLILPYEDLAKKFEKRI